MNARTLMWWTLLGGFILIGIAAWSYESQFSGWQTELIYQLGEDITSNQKKWEDARLNDAGAFAWQRDLSLGHGFTMLTSSITQMALLGIAAQLAITLFLLKRKTAKNTQRSGPDNPRPCGTSGMSPADPALRAGDTPEASGGI